MRSIGGDVVSPAAALTAGVAALALYALLFMVALETARPGSCWYRALLSPWAVVAGSAIGTVIGIAVVVVMSR